jgi:hypothetical protein
MSHFDEWRGCDVSYPSPQTQTGTASTPEKLAKTSHCEACGAQIPGRALCAAQRSGRAQPPGKGANEEDFTTLLDQFPAEWQRYHSRMRFFVFWDQKEG